jgi:two-component system NarL family sensor kinase
MPVPAGPNVHRASDYRWTALLALAVGLLATAAAWRAERAHEQSDVRWATALAARAVRENLVTDVEWQMLGLDRLAMLWEAADPPQELWTRNAELYIQHRPGCVAVEWLTSSRERRVLVTRHGTINARPLAFAGRPEALLDAVSKAKIAMISAPEKLSDGSRQWVIAYPVYGRGQPRGYVVTFFDLEQSLAHILADVGSLGFSFGMSQPNQPEYVPPGTSREHEQEWGTAVAVPLPGTTWRLRVWPRGAVLSQVRSNLPEITEMVGVVVTLLLALSLYLGANSALVYGRARLANEALQREISAREGVQEELRRTQAELEVRVDRRTADLAAANALLQREVTEHRQAEERLRDLTGRLFQLQDEERRRLGRELHDGAVQNLVALAMNVGMIRDALPVEDKDSKELASECVALIEQSTSELRTISYLLHPPYFDELGLTASLRDFADGFATRSGIQVALDIDPNFGRLRHDVELGIYRVIQEALSNVHRHAESRTATISLARHPEFVRLEVADLGRGIPPEILAPEGARFAGVGIAAMRERIRGLGGRLEIQSDAGGTRIQAVLPVPVPSTSRNGAGRDG